MRDIIVNFRFKTLLTHPMSFQRKEEAYISHFINWYDRATVRSGPKRELVESVFDEPGRFFFAPGVAPIANHPKVLQKNCQSQVLMAYLYHLLGFTTHLEHEVVNLSAKRIAHHELSYDLDQDMKLDAFKIYCDEAYHALFTAEFTFQIQNYLKISYQEYQYWIRQHPFFVLRNKLKTQYPAKDEYLIDLTASIVSEVLITHTLKHIPSEKSVIAPVREIIRDHAKDEGLHSLYFCKLFQVVWEQLDEYNQRVMGELLPQYISAYLSPNLTFFQQYLLGLGFQEYEIEQILRESYPPEMVAGTRQAASEQLVRVLRKSGVFDNPDTRWAFASHNILPMSVQFQ